MRHTLRRSCAACANSKHSCDLRTPRCSRCLKRNVQCTYANAPLNTAPPASGRENDGLVSYSTASGPLTSYRFGSLDPFQSYPQTRLPREHVQRLMHSCTYDFPPSYQPQLAYQASSSQDRVSILSARSERNFKSIPYLLVATRFGRPGIISYLAADSMPRRGAIGPERL